MQIALPERATSATLILDDGVRLTDEEYFAFCEANPDLSVERTAQGDIVIVPPAGLESDGRNVKVIGFLDRWAEQDGRGEAFGATAQFLLPDGSGLSADASWVSHQKLSALSAAEKKRFPKLVPDFVIEVMSPSDRLRSAQRKMRQWAGNGVELGWLIDGDGRRVYVYRGTAEPCLVSDAESIAGEGPVEGFVLPLGKIWRGLQD
jgi:Uma2 family endonuclease